MKNIQGYRLPSLTAMPFSDDENFFDKEGGRYAAPLPTTMTEDISVVESLGEVLRL
jgi:hypothetical protein